MTRRIPRLGALATLLGASLLMTSPPGVQAREGKWWTPSQGNHARVQGDFRWGRGSGGFTRQWRTWGGRRVYRDVIVIRSARRVPRYQAWRTYCPPDYIYSRRIIRVRPVRFYVSAAAVIGGVSIHGSYHRYDDCEYGCNFCDARFDDYESYREHVATCPHRPRGYRVEVSNWDDSAGPGWDDDRAWRTDDGYPSDDRYGTDDPYRNDDRCRDNDNYRSDDRYQGDDRYDDDDR